MIYFVQMITWSYAQLANLSHAASLSVLDNDEIQFHLLSPDFISKRKSENKKSMLFIQ